MFGRQFWSKCNALPKVRQMSSNQIPRPARRYMNTAAVKNSKASLCTGRLLRGINTATVDANVNFLKQMDRFSILRCSAVGISTACQSIICLSDGEGVLESSEDEDEACPVKRQSLANQQQAY